MDKETVFWVLNGLFGVIGFGVAWWVNTLWSKQRETEKDVARLNVELAKNYPTRAEINDTLKQIFEGIDDVRKEVTHISRNQASFTGMQAILDAVKQERR